MVSESVNYGVRLVWSLSVCTVPGHVLTLVPPPSLPPPQPPSPPSPLSGYGWPPSVLE